MTHVAHHSEKSRVAWFKVTDQGSQEATPESCGDGAMVDADPLADYDGNKTDWETEESVDGFETNSMEGSCSKGPGRGREQGRKYADSLEFGARPYTKEAKEQRVRRWQRHRKETAPVRAREEGARVQGGAVLSSFARPDKTNERTEVRTVVPPEVPHDTRICVEDSVDMEIDQLKDDENKGKQPGNGTQEPMKKTARDRDPRTREQTARDRDPRNCGDEGEVQGESVDIQTRRTWAKKQTECADEIICSYLDQRGIQVGNVRCELF